MLQKSLLIVCIMLVSGTDLICQDTLKSPKRGVKEKIKKGWTFGALPAIAYESDVGFKYGAVVNFYNFGDGSTYPKYMHSLYLEWSRTTKGSGINQFMYDSEYLIPGIRITAEATVFTEKALDFYGYNGYESLYNKAFEETDDPEYITRMFYRIDRNLTKLRGEFQGGLIDKKLRWMAGFVYYGNKIGTVDIDNLNKGRKEKDQLPDTATLYDKYVEWGIIPEDEKDGGRHGIFKVGLVYDTRDNEPNPMSGLWSEMQFLIAPAFLSDKNTSYSRIVLSHRQYFTIVPKRLSFTYRLTYQGKISGEMPFYMLPFIFNSPPSTTRDGLGGSKTLRGILRNRVVGEDFLLGNLELRWKFIRALVLKQNIYFSFNVFTDFGLITGKYDFDRSGIPLSENYLFPGDKDKMHHSYGAGLRLALNENFIGALDYGLAADKRDGDSGLYIGLNFLF
jgi:outer membrane protein assembly factor BamA